MDNASKALIIAGAILIAVMLVSLGVMLYNVAAGVAEGTIGSIESLGVEGFNAQFNDYLGERVKMSVVNGLIEKVIANNQQTDTTITLVAAKGASTHYNPSVTTASDATNLTTMKGQLTAKDTVYKVEVTKRDTSGAINQITITGVAK